jgi:predicted glutamine amidotransferase
MCRWVAYSGSPILLADLIYRPSHSLIDQSMRSKLSVQTTNGDGFGIGWYSNGGRPGMFHSVGPAWSNRNLRELSEQIEAPIFLAHVRASTGTPVQESNCHPFRYDNWLWMHNGSIAQFRKIKRELVFAIAPDLYPAIQGSTDSEVMFFLALTFGLRDDPSGAVARMAGFVEETAQAHGIPNALQMTVATSDGHNIWGFRYSTMHSSRSLFYSTAVETMRHLYPNMEMLQDISEESRLIVSEPFGELEGAWNAVPESMWGVIRDGTDKMAMFRPIRP